MARQHADLLSRRSVVKRAVASTAILSALAVPASRLIAQESPVPAFTDDSDVLSYALTLENMTSAFYADGLARITPEDLPGDDPEVARTRLNEIASHEAAHVVALTEVITSLGGQAPSPATYAFDYDDTEAFLEIALAIENTSVAAYAGAIVAASDPAVITALLSIHSVEGRHAAFLGGLLRHQSPFPTAFDEALTRREVEEIIAVFSADGVPAAETPSPGEPPAPPREEPPGATPSPTAPPQATPIPLGERPR
jgi:rubrerythrin